MRQQWPTAQLFSLLHLVDSGWTSFLEYPDLFHDTSRPPSMMSIASSAFSFFSRVALAAFILTAPALSALSPLPTEQHRRSPAIIAMAAFSPLAITGYTLLAFVTSYSLLRFYQFLKTRVLSSAAGAALPQPVSAGRISYYLPLPSFFPFSRSRRKPARAHNLTRNRWSPLSSIFRRLTRPSSPLHLSDAELLPTTMSDSPSAHIHSLIDLPIISGSPSVPVVQFHDPQSNPTRKLSKASSMDALPLYRPLTPVPVIIPRPVHVALPPPSTPPPPSPTHYPCMIGTDIQLVPITPQKRRCTPVNINSQSNSPTLPLINTLPAISLSPFGSTAIPSSDSPVGPRPSSSNPSLFLSSRTLSSLSLSPPMQQHKRSKSLGGVAVKKISPPQFKNISRSEGAGNESDVGAGYTQPRFLGMYGNPQDELVRKSSIASPPAGFPKFHLNISSSSSSSVSSSSRSTESPSPSPLTANSESAASSAPLQSPCGINNTSYLSNGITKSLENEPLLSIVDADMIMDTNAALGYGADEKLADWMFDTEPIPVARVFEDFGGIPDAIPSYEKTPLLASERGDGTMIEERWGASEVDRKLDVERMRVWEWDEDVEGQKFGWSEEKEPRGLDFEAQSEVTSDNAAGIEVLPLSTTIVVLPPLLDKPVEVPSISICTADEVLGRKDSGIDSGIVSASSLGGTTPVSLGQTPTPPASPPRDPRITPLPKVNKSSQDRALSSSATTSPVAESHVVTVDLEAQEDEVWPSPRVEQESEDVLLANDVSLECKAVGVEEPEENPFFPDKPMFSSPESISTDLPGACEITICIESHCDEVDWTNESGDGCRGVQSSKGKSPWIYDTDDEIEESDTEIHDFEVSVPSSDDEDENFEQEQDEGGVAWGLEDFSVDENAQFVTNASEGESVGDSVIQMCPDPEVVTPSPQIELTSTSPTAVSQEDVASTLVAAVLALQPSTSLPGSFPDIPAQSTSITEPVQDTGSSLLPQRSQRIRSTLEEAITRTRSPLEVALAMQLRPGLGPGADPAWMVRFMMVMWGWVFSLALGEADA